MTRKKFLIFFFYLFGAPLFAKSPLIEISYKFDAEIQPMNSQSQFLFFDCTGDGRKELVIQTNRDFYIYRIDIKNKTLVFMKKISGIPPGTESGRCQYCLGALSPDHPRSIIVKSQTGVYYFPFNNEGLAEKPELISPITNRSDLPSVIDDFLKPARLIGAPFIQDVEGDGYDEIILGMGDEINILKICDKKPILSTPPQTKTPLFRKYKITNQTAGISYFETSLTSIIPSPKNNSFEILVLKNPKDAPCYEIFETLNPLGYAALPNQTLRFDKTLGKKLFDAAEQSRGDSANQTAHELLFRRLLDINGDGWFDLVTVTSNRNFLSPLTKADIYLSPAAADFYVCNPSSTVRMRDPLGLAAFVDFNNDGALDLFNLRMDYNPSSMDDVADYILGETVRYSANVYLFNKDKNIYPEQPDWALPLKMKFEVFYRSISPFDVLSDFNGDGLNDLLIWADNNEARVHLCGSKGFEKRPYFKIKGDDISLCLIDKINNGAEEDLVLFSLKQMRINLFILGEE
ncbi:MAG TPA: VCBS repeat-containing protein [Candidatus Sumerlaeota bacterium]|nr:MAG: FG-GAP repeat protein [candidate division BRC1 bacterium ADurb.Bin183]HOE63811.1 VCBS repeat-containing protein [Candidatus Sumerlaeota bacterium]HRR30077.1 VCBS repeat-containing protein [Candidatus Sumerlaeia bacterium]HON49738.1 VCBS repeat-containing protein [Candidatus Sumerlaeota bacterium]HOR64014.1 VCBS repeat-containing protein [Candidatus Sumerlaeota bacterium]